MTTYSFTIDRDDGKGEQSRGTASGLSKATVAQHAQSMLRNIGSDDKNTEIYVYGPRQKFVGRAAWTPSGRNTVWIPALLLED